MLVFSTRLPLKESVTQEICLNMFFTWIIHSPHYSIDKIDYDLSSHKDFDFCQDNISFSIRHYKDDNVELSACRLENKEENFTWQNDCIFVEENNEKYLLIQLNRNRTHYDIDIPRVNKPHIVKLFVESGYCKKDAGLPIVDIPLESDKVYYDKCSNIINGTYHNTMPVVYISCDYWGNTDVDANFLAKILSGTAHVFVERNYETALRLRKDTDSNNVYTGYVGIYFPQTRNCQKYGIGNYRDDRHMCGEIISSVWNALANGEDATSYSWNQIIALQARQKMLQWKDNNEQTKQELSDYINTFDVEKDDLRGQIRVLREQLYSACAERDNLKEALLRTDSNGAFYNIGTETNLYNGEFNDLLFSILTQVKDKYPTESRAYTIIESLLEANPKVGECEKILSEIKEMCSSMDRLTPSIKDRFNRLGFNLKEDESSHYKFVFHDDRYMFTVSKTPSDHRSGKNLVAEINRILDIEKKI